ncbi:polyadenylate-binding protein-interacting protein 1-like isoform X2 [Montipora foliosa]|uniref:polyadenylate-binding protein-interacting protein 1-like isoform X2 n=1 Tax=Montipora foliosa TaxID=591990 RepID=UPI0035F1A7C7
MPGRGRGFTSKDYQAPLRKPGEKLETAVAQNDGAQKPASASDESEKEEPTINPASASNVKHPQLSEEKTVDKTINSEEGSGQDASTEQNTESTVTDLSEATEKDEPPAISYKEEDLAVREVEIETTVKDEATAAEESRPDDSVIQNTEMSNTDSSEATEKALEGANFAKKEDLNVGEMQIETTVQGEGTATEPTDQATSLSPFAAEFVPKSSFSLQSAVDAAEFVPGAFSHQSERPALLRQQSDKPENELMNCVKDVLFGLMQSPGELYFYFTTLVKMLKKWLSSLESLKEVVDLIFEYSITEPNFQYIAAKLCNMLSKERSIELQNGERFRSVLMNRCRDEHVIREKSYKNPETAEKLLGFALFEAELFCHYRPLGETEPLRVFHRGLLEMLNTLLQNPAENCLTCVGKMLKMTGYLLDDPHLMKNKEGEYVEDRKSKVDKIFSDVEKLSQDSSLPDSVTSLLSQVITLRSKKWETGSSSSTVYPSDDVSYYLPDFTFGMDDLCLQDDLTPVTNPDQWSDYYDDADEEASIHDTYKYYFPDQYNEEYSHEEDNGYYLEDDPEFDDEIDAEFEKFLQEQ